jgi:hypothetical protein
MPKKIGENLRKILKMIKKTNDPYQYTIHKKPQTHEWRQEQERQHKVNLISIAMITLMCMIGISVILYFSIYGV